MARKCKVSGHGAKLRKAREARGWSLEEAAANAGISTPRASELERCHTIPTSPAARQYAQLLGFRIGRTRLSAVSEAETA